ncbi:Crp/Fnr family transcriptional regulator [Almyronema epifaneia]|uniref:Crp/Fnr family transcriptional regulator n=1 Tax=Almyronema epifaneia S1 TaxID=2991925 RepID=A0ABW6IJP7_9CYAN
MAHRNRLLSVMSPQLYQKLKPHLTEIYLEQGTILHRPTNIIEYLYFPIDCLLSITITTESGNTAETGLVGNRDLLGINAFMGSAETTQTEYIVQISGQAIRADAPPLLAEFDTNKEMRDIVLRYTQALIAQISQTTACNRLHVLEQRLARWLLESSERIEKDELYLTQGFIADMLGVRRAGVTQSAQALQRQGLIQYRNGYVKIVDRSGLESAACECFRVVIDEYDRLLGVHDY